jgi:hypothetical protein
LVSQQTIFLLALNPVFVRRTAVGLELDSDRIELVEQQRSTDPTLRHIALALRAGIQSGAALDRMYGEALATVLAVHLLRESGAAALWPKSFRLTSKETAESHKARGLRASASVGC